MSSNEELQKAITQLARAQLQTQQGLEQLTKSVDTLVQGGGDSARQGRTFHDNVDSNGSSRAPLPVGPDLQALAKQVADKYRSVVLDPAHKLHEDRVGLKREDQKTVNIISKCGRFTETCLKILQNQGLIIRKVA